MESYSSSKKSSSKGGSSAVQVCIRVRPKGVNQGGQADYSEEVVGIGSNNKIQIIDQSLGPFSNIIDSRMD